MSAHRGIGLLSLLLGLGACAGPEYAELEPLQIEVLVVGSATVSYDSLRVAVLYQGAQGGLEVGADVAVTATGTATLMTLLPPSTIERGARLEALQLPPSQQALLVARPRILAYLDLDGSESFQNGRQMTGPDQPLGADGYWQTLGRVVDPWAAIASLGPDAAQAYYRLTDNRFTPFIRLGREAGGNLVADTAPEPYALDATRLSITPADLACQGNLRNAESPPNEVLLWVDRSLDALVLCGLEVPHCLPVDTSTLTPPALPQGPVPNAFVARNSQCRRRRGVEVLIVQEDRLRCAPSTCGCANEISIEAVATATSAVKPPWWPCGETVDYCDSPLPLYQADPECYPQPEPEPDDEDQDDG